MRGQFFLQLITHAISAIGHWSMTSGSVKPLFKFEFMDLESFLLGVVKDHFFLQVFIKAITPTGPFVNSLQISVPETCSVELFWRITSCLIVIGTTGCQDGSDERT